MARLRRLGPVLVAIPALIAATALAGAVASTAVVGQPGCGLAQSAFCDTFATFTPQAQQTGREGDLNPLNWSFSRITSDVSPFPLDTANTYYPATADFCGTSVGVEPEWDSFICSTVTPNMPGTWGSVINDGGIYDTSVRLGGGDHPQTKEGYYVANAARIRQPFDFAGRTGTVTFKVDAQLDGSGNDRPHGAWPEVWLTDQPVQAPHLNYPGTNVYPRNGINFTFNDCPGASSSQNVNSINKIAVFNNYVETDLALPAPADCFQTQKDNPNQFQLKIAQNNVQVWGSDAGGANFRMLASVPVNLNFSRGYLSFEHATYNAAKYGASNTSTFHWQAIGFDGPALPVDRGYEVPDALHVNTAADQQRGSSNTIGSVNLGYQVGTVSCNTAGCSTPTFNLAGVDPTNADQAYLTYNVWYDGAPRQMTATVNGVPFTFADPAPGSDPVLWHSLVQPIPLSALRAGTNTVSFADPGSAAQNATIANVDLEIVPTTTAPPPTTTTIPPTTTTVPVTTTTVPVTTTTVPPTTTTVPVTTTTVPVTRTVPPPGDSFKQVAAVTPQRKQTTVKATLANSEAAGDLNVLAIGWNDTVAKVTSVTDSRRNAYRVAAPLTRGNGKSQAIYYAPNVLPGPDTVTVKFSTGARYVDLRIAEYAGGYTLDAAGSATHKGGTASASVVTTTSNELVVAATVGGYVKGPGAGFSARIITQPDGDILEDRVAPTAGSYAASTTGAPGGWVAQAVAFANSGPPPPPTTTTVPPTTTTVPPTTTTSVPSSTTTTVPSPPALSVKVAGTHLVGGNGQTFIPRGVNRSGSEYACAEWGGVFDGPSDAASVAAIASWHTNVVRLGLNEDCWLGINGAPVNGLTAAQYRTAIENYVTLLHAHGLAAILELHWSAPGTFLATSQEAMADADHSPTFWASVASAFKGDPATMLDLFNEPTTVDWNCWLNGCATTGFGGRGTWQTAGMQSMVNAVRGTGATNVVLLGGLGYAGDLTGWLSHQPNDPTNQTAASFHVYNFSSCNTSSCWDSQVTPVAGAVPVVTGEIGETDGTASFINTYMGWADPKGIGYLGWTWDTWGCGGAVLISNYDGTACPGFGAGYQAHLG